MKKDWALHALSLREEKEDLVLLGQWDKKEIWEEMGTMGLKDVRDKREIQVFQELTAQEDFKDLWDFQGYFKLS